MSAETDIIALLRNNAPLSTNVTGVFLNAADEDQAMPYVVVTTTHAPELTIDGKVDLDHITYTLAVWGTGAAVAEGVADLVVAAIRADDDYSIIARTGGFDEQTANDAAVVTADRWM